MAVILPAVPNVLKIQWKWTVGTDATVWSHMFWQYSGSAPSGVDLATFAGQVQSKWATNMNALQRSDVLMTGVYVTDLSNRTTMAGVWNGSVAGTRSSGAIPAQTAALLVLTIARRYRGGKPRLYLPLGNNIDVTAPQAWTTAFVTAANTGWTNYFNALASSSVGPATLVNQVSVSYYSGHALRPTPVVDPLVSFHFSSVPASQRRRMNR